VSNKPCNRPHCGQIATAHSRDKTSASLLFFLANRPPPTSPLFPYTTLFRSVWVTHHQSEQPSLRHAAPYRQPGRRRPAVSSGYRSEEHTSELQSRGHLVCRLLLEKKKAATNQSIPRRAGSMFIISRSR